jgi:hypothetical protein
MDSSALRKLVDAVDKAKVVSRPAANYDLSQLDPAMVSQVVYAAVSCCMNGPVGVNKRTTFPGESAEYSLKDKWPGLTNSVWREFCRDVARLLPSDGVEVKTCYTVAKFGQLWPFCEATFTPKVRTTP